MPARSAAARPAAAVLLFVLVAAHRASSAGGLGRATALFVSPATQYNTPLLGTLRAGGSFGGRGGEGRVRSAAVAVAGGRAGWCETGGFARGGRRRGFRGGDGGGGRSELRSGPSSFFSDFGGPAADDDGGDGDEAEAEAEAPVDADAELKDKNAKYVLGLMSNLQSTLDGYVLSGSPMAREQTYNILSQIGLHALPANDELVRKASRMMIRAGLDPTEDGGEGGGGSDAGAGVGNGGEGKKMKMTGLGELKQPVDVGRVGGVGKEKKMTGLGQPQPIDVTRRPPSPSSLTTKSSTTTKGDGGGKPQPTDVIGRPSSTGFGGGGGGLGGASPPPTVEAAGANVEARRREALERKEWEAEFREEGKTVARGGVATSGGKGGGRGTGGTGATGAGLGVGRSALSSRNSKSVSAKAEAYMSDLDSGFARVANDKKALEEEVGGRARRRVGRDGVEDDDDDELASTEEEDAAAALASELVARAGADSAFDGETMGIGGLDDVLAHVKRRVWVPLAAPPSLLAELGINPVRGLLLYGKPGCGKTLLARTLGKILSPARPITVVSGPEIMDKFVGSSEANLRRIFDEPPDIHPRFRESTTDGGAALSRAALHVVVLDEFDAVARSRGGRGGGGSDQGDAGVARDSVVNQLLAKMDGVDALCVPTLVVGLTNKRSLIEPALLRSGRFEVQIEVPPPRTVAQRVSILRVHTYNMYRAGRVLVNDPPAGTAASRRLRTRRGYDGVLTYEELLEHLGRECKGMSGACLAGVCRAAASRALERAVYDFAGAVSSDDGRAPGETGGLIADCLITIDDFEKAIDDVFESSRGGDGGDDWELTDDPNGGEDGEKKKAYLRDDVAYEGR